MNQNTVLENLSASQLRIVVTDESGAESRCTLGEFVHVNRSELPRTWRKTAAHTIANGIRAFGYTALNLNPRGIFTLRAE